MYMYKSMYILHKVNTFHFSEVICDYVTAACQNVSLLTQLSTSALDNTRRICSFILLRLCRDDSGMNKRKRIKAAFLRPGFIHEKEKVY